MNCATIHKKFFQQVTRPNCQTPDRPTFEDYTLKRMKDPYGYDPNKFTNELRVVYDCSKGRDVTVELVKVDDKWYLNSFPQ